MSHTLSHTLTIHPSRSLASHLLRAILVVMIATGLPSPAMTAEPVSAPQPLLSGDLLRPTATSFSLPTAPSAKPQSKPVRLLSLENPDNPQPMQPAHLAPLHMKYIPAGWTAQPITPHDKVLLGLKDLVSPLDALGMLTSAGYSFALKGEPNYGTNRGAFGETLGAAAIRETTEGIFTDTVFAPLLHEDPRYYVEGTHYGFFHRFAYAGTREILTHTDSGHSSVNGAMILGYAASSALSYTYYPKINKNFDDTAATMGGSLGGAAIGFLVSEFSDSVLQALHLEKKQ